ncbi:hypothetical protein ABZ897_01225 [Nonomuraea sp. NPDC046802]|uniref:hypothetical protein n=1 Tax=Nonomuraea sp. NPDC046802 TaxID=3154919 RepID=UPI0033D72C71
MTIDAGAAPERIRGTAPAVRDGGTVMPKRRKKVAYALTGLAVAAAGTVAAGMYVTRPTAAAPPVVPIGQEAIDLVLPFDRYWLSTFDIHTVESAEDILIRDCLQRDGMDWPLLPSPDRQAEQPPNRRRYGVIEPGLAANYGYHLPPPDPITEKRETGWSERRKLPAEVRIAAYGKEGGAGCWKKAHDHLLRNTAPYDAQKYNKYVGEAFDAARRDPQVVTGIRAWSACMKRAGFAYPDPFKAAGDKEWAKTPRPLPRELATATADVRCKQETDLVGIWARVDTRIQQNLIREHESDFRQLAEAKARWLEAARQTLPENAGPLPSPRESIGGTGRTPT